MGDWPIVSPFSFCELVGRNAATSAMVDLTSNAVANTKGNYTQLLAATARNHNRIVVYPAYATDSGLDWLIDISIGGAGSETVLLSNLFRESWGQIFALGPLYDFPISIPAGTRISARCQSHNTGNKKVRIGIHLIDGSFFKDSFSVVDTYGAATADSGGTSIDPGGVANTKGNWVELSASIIRPIKFIMISYGNQRNFGRALADWLVDIGVGAAGSEVVVIPDIPFNCGANLTLYPVNSVLYPVNIPAGTRLAVRAMSSNIDATDRLFDAIIYGVC